MAAINTLLNPLPELGKRSLELDPRPPPLQSPVAISTYYHENSRSPPAQHKKQKVSKDAAIFNRGSIRGKCRYPPHEEQDELLAAQHQQFEITPIGRIAECPRHIPYNSEKKAYLQKTGRESFEVFHYEFRVPGDEKVYVMMWDYNIGLVRTTPLFRCNGYSKTTPAKMLSRNEGLRDICHSITGGALVAQGYWMPYAAARASAATFCWKIRYALTPVFGTDFPAMCIPPDGEHFGEMVIDPAITQECREQAEQYRALEPAVICGAVAGTSGCSAASSAISSPISPSDTSTTYRQAAAGRQIKALRPKGMALGLDLKLRTTTTTAASNGAGGGSRSGYSTDDNYSLGSAHSLALSLTPPPLCSSSSATASKTTYRNTWTAANTPRSVPITGLDSSSHRLPSPREILAGISDAAVRSHGHDHSHHRCHQQQQQQHHHHHRHQHRLPELQQNLQHSNANPNSNNSRSRSHSASSVSSLSSAASPAASSSLSSSPAVSPKTCRPRSSTNTTTTNTTHGVTAAADEEYDGDSSSDGAATPLHAGDDLIGNNSSSSNSSRRQQAHGGGNETRKTKSTSKSKSKSKASKRERAAADLGNSQRRGGVGAGAGIGALMEPSDEKAAYLLMSLKVKDPEARLSTSTGGSNGAKGKGQAAGTGTADAAVGLTLGKKRRASA